MECLYQLDYIAQIEGITKIIWLVYIHGMFPLCSVYSADIIYIRQYESLYKVKKKYILKKWLCAVRYLRKHWYGKIKGKWKHKKLTYIN